MSDVVSGVLKLAERGGGVLRDPARSFVPGPGDVVVPPPLVRDCGLVEGATVAGPVRRAGRQTELIAADSICGLDREAFLSRPRFDDLVAIDPCQRFHLACTDSLSMRVVDLIAPIGKGTRGLIVSPPKAGKTMLLMDVARSVRRDDPETRIIVLLIDERPEEVTHFRRGVDAEVLASTSDQSMQQHVDLAELTLAHIRVDLECGRDVVVLVDSLTRMGRAFNQADPASVRNRRGRSRTSRRILSGGLEAGSMEIPRRFFGLARNIEGGGSVTILATALIDTGSRMDQVIFEEFKGTGNCEIVLDRSLADRRVFPAIDLTASGTRKEERLYEAEAIRRLAKLRRALADRDPKEAMELMLEQLQKYPTNEAFLKSIPLK